LPARDALTTGAWSICSTMPTGQNKTAVTTLAAAKTTSGNVLASGQALLVRDGDDNQFAITGGQRLRIKDDAVTVALGYDAITPVPVADSWLNALPAGPDLALIKVSGAGNQGPRVGQRDTLVGQVLMVAASGDGNRYYRVQANALAPITETEAALILGNPANQDAYPDGAPRTITVSAADLAGSDSVMPGKSTSDYPAILPKAVKLGEVNLCAVSDGDGPMEIRMAATPPVPAGARAVAVKGDKTADFVYVPPGSGALVTQRGKNTTYLVSDQGIRYALGGDQELAALGYAGVRADQLSAALVTLLPTGPTLAMKAAQQ
jgi:type VII secretion protein EccB